MGVVGRSSASVTMDQMMVDCRRRSGRGRRRGVLIGTPGRRARSRPTEWADRLGTIGYEIVCGISARESSARYATRADALSIIVDRSMLQLRSDSAGGDVMQSPRRLAGVARRGDIIVLAGEMGAGKTAFAQGFGAALGVAEPITSPTFTLVHSYPAGRRHPAPRRPLPPRPACTRSTIWRSASCSSPTASCSSSGAMSSPARSAITSRCRLDVRRRRRGRPRDRRSRADGTGVGRAWAALRARLAPCRCAVLILGIETATAQVSVAIGGHEGVLALFEVCRGRRHAETLMPAIEFVCRQADIELVEIGAIAVDVGPGLFTGMRVGLAAAKAIAQALRRADDRHLSRSTCWRSRCARPTALVVRVIDARKGEVFYADLPAGARRGAAHRRTDGRLASTTRRRPARPRPRRAVRRRRCRCATAARSRAAVARARSPSSPRPSVGGAAGAARPRPCAARGVGQPVGDRSRCTCASPTPRSTGPRAPTASTRCVDERAVAVAAARRRRDELVDRTDAPPAPARGAGDRAACRTRSRGRPTCSTSELEHGRARQRVLRRRPARRRSSSATPG